MRSSKSLWKKKRLQEILRGEDDEEGEEQKWKVHNPY